MPDAPTQPSRSASQQWELAQSKLAQQSKPVEIKTLDEQQHLEAQRKPPTIELKLTPGGIIEEKVHTAEALRNEVRIKAINDSLQKASDNLNKDFDRAR